MIFVKNVQSVYIYIAYLLAFLVEATPQKPLLTSEMTSEGSNMGNISKFTSYY